MSTSKTDMKQEEFKNIVEERPAVLKTLQRVAISSNPTPSMAVGVDDVILLSIVLPLTSYLVREIGFPWLSEVRKYSELWRLKVDAWIDEQYKQNGIDKDQAKLVGQALKEELENIKSTEDREVWKEVLKLLQSDND